MVLSTTTSLLECLGKGEEKKEKEVEEIKDRVRSSLVGQFYFDNVFYFVLIYWSLLCDVDVVE